MASRADIYNTTVYLDSYFLTLQWLTKAGLHESMLYGGVFNLDGWLDGWLGQIRDIIEILVRMTEFEVKKLRNHLKTG